MNLDEARQVINECDAQMVALFEKRMGAVREVALYKMEQGLPVFDSAREQEVIARNVALLTDGSLAKYFATFGTIGLMSCLIALAYSRISY